MADCRTCKRTDVKCCPTCGRGDGCDVYHKCGEDCIGYKPMTNADRIRSMTDEELAEYGFDKLVVSQQTVEAKPVVHGEWIKTFRYMRKNINTGKLEPVYSCDCPICKYHTGNQGVRFNFCPNCGADMRGKKNE